MTFLHIEEVVHVVVAKPIAWTIYGIWQGLIWAGRVAVDFGHWTRDRWVEYRQKREVRRSSVA